MIHTTQVTYFIFGNIIKPYNIVYRIIWRKQHLTVSTAYT